MNQKDDKNQDKDVKLKLTDRQEDSNGSQEDGDDSQEELLKAYEADRQRRTAKKDDELKAAKDYLGVLLEEIESKNSELEEKRREAKRLEEALEQSESERVENEEQSGSRRRKVSAGWVPFAITEAIVIIALVVVMVLMNRNTAGDNAADSGNDGQNTAQNTASEKGSGTDGTITDGTASDGTQTAAEQPQTAKHVENLQAKFDDAEKIGFLDYKCSIEKIDGLEYLVFQKDGIRICYKNEYYLNDRDFYKSVLIEKGSRRTIQKYSYSFDGDLKLLCPKECQIGDEALLVLTDYAGPGRIPQNLRLINKKTLAEYDGDGLKDRINGLMTVAFADGGTGIADYPQLMTLTTSKAEYKYGIPEITYNDIVYNEQELTDIESWFSMEIGDAGITWRTVVKSGDKFYLGELAGEVSVAPGSIYVSGAKFGAYAPANQENPELNGVIIPRTLIPERYLTINGQNSERYYIEYNDNIEPCRYDWAGLKTEDSNDWIYCDESGQQISIRGIDVSKYQGDVDWKKVAEAGVKFAIVRMGFRGMNEGTLETDPYFVANVKGALAEGIKVGVYFFSQAVNEAEALEEADFVLDAIRDFDIEYPVIFDTERVTTFDARANSLSYEQRTDNTIAFCDRVAEAGYTPMIYANTKYMIMGIDLERLGKYDRWFAVYNDKITFPYHFSMLQYSESGSIPGVTGNCDLDISFVDYSKKNQEP